MWGIQCGREQIGLPSGSLGYLRVSAVPSGKFSPSWGAGIYLEPQDPQSQSQRAAGFTIPEHRYGRRLARRKMDPSGETEDLWQDV